MWIVRLTFVFLLVGFLKADFPACGNDILSKPYLENNINNHVNKLIAMKNEDAWINTPEAVTSIYLTQPESLTSLNKVVNTMVTELKNISNIPTGKLGQYALAVHATCTAATNFRNINFGQEIIHKLKNEFNYNGIDHALPRNGWYGVFVAVGAYCITQKNSPGDFYIHRLLHAKNHDGSFDPTHSVDHTAQAMISLLCLSRINAVKSSQQKHVETALNLASQFLIQSKVITERDSTWIGDKHSSPTAVIAINEHSLWTDELWRCRLIMKSLNNPVGDDESESAISQRLLALKGISVLKLLDESYNCQQQQGESEQGVSEEAPSTEKSTDTNCEDDSDDTMLLSSFEISVRMSVHPYAFAHGETKSLDKKSFTLTGVTKGKTLLDMMKTAQCQGLFTFKTQTTAWGDYITTIDGVEAKSENRAYWAIQNKGEDLLVGINQYKPSHDDRISFKLKHWS